MHVDKQGYMSNWKSQIWRGASCVSPWLVYLGRQPQTVAADGLSEGKAKVKGLLLLAAALLLTSSAYAAVPPNIILILADDLGYGDASFSGGKIRTPRLDELAAGGLRFNDFHANSNCTPTRAALMTGRYSQRSGLLAPLTWESTKGLSQNEITLPEVLRPAGYATGLVGKWHLGKQDTFAPNLNGFDYFFGLRGALIDYKTHHEPNAGFLDWYRNQALVDRQEYSTTALTREAKGFISRNAGKPFFLEVAYNAVHGPYQGPGDPPGVSRPEHYASMVKAMDAGIGQVIDHLRALSLEGNTLIFFTSDNGAFTPGSNLPLRGFKNGAFEGSIRTPTIAYWPGRIQPGVTDATTHVIDLLPTFAELSGAPLPDRPLDGRSFALVFDRSDASLPPRRLFWAYKQYFAVRDGDWKLVIKEGISYLFNLRTDLSEQHDLSAANPAKVQELNAALEQWKVDVGI